MALSKVDYNSLNVTPAASKALKWNSDADGFETGDVGGSMVLIKTLTASSSSALSFVNGSSDVVLDNTYSVYKFVWLNIHPSAQEGDGNEFAFDVSINAGGAYDTVAKTTSYFIATHAENDTSTSFGHSDTGDASQGTGTQYLSIDNDNDNDASNSGEMYLYNPSSTTYAKHFIAKNNYMHSQPLSINTYIGGYLNTTSAVDAVKFVFTGSCTIESGTIKMYGVL